MSKHNILFIGLDTHKEFIEVAYIEDQRGEGPSIYGENRLTSGCKSASIYVLMPLCLNLALNKKPIKSNFTIFYIRERFRACSAPPTL